MATLRYWLFINTLVRDAVLIPVDALGFAQQEECRDFRFGPGRDD